MFLGKLGLTFCYVSLFSGCCYVYARCFGRSNRMALHPGIAVLLVSPYLVDTEESLGLGLFPPCVRKVGCSPPIGRRVAGLKLPAFTRQTVVTISFIAFSYFNTQKRETRFPVPRTGLASMLVSNRQHSACRCLSSGPSIRGRLITGLHSDCSLEPFVRP